MLKKQHEPISRKRFYELLKANVEIVVDCENAIKAAVAKGGFVGNATGKLLDFFEKFDDEDGQKMVLTIIFFFGMNLGRALGSEEGEAGLEKLEKAGDSGSSKN